MVNKKKNRAVNKRIYNKMFQITGWLQQEDLNSSFLFAMQMTPLCKMIETKRQTCGIKLAEGELMSIGS